MRANREKIMSPLRHQRELRGWSQGDVARRLNGLTESDEETRQGGATIDMIRTWERGFHTPSPFYRRRLCLLFNLSAADLGFIKLDEDESRSLSSVPQVGTEECIPIEERQSYTGLHSSSEAQRLISLLSNTVQKWIREAPDDLDVDDIEKGYSIVNQIDSMKRSTLRRILTALSILTTNPQTTSDFKWWEKLNRSHGRENNFQTIDLELVDDYANALKSLLANGETQYVMYSSQSLYHRLLQAYPSEQDKRMIDVQLKLGLLVGAAQEYTLGWYQRDQAVIHTYNQIENSILERYRTKDAFLLPYAQLLAKRGRQHRVLWKFDLCEQECEKGLLITKELNDLPLRIHFLCEQAHIEATRGNEAAWMKKLEIAYAEIGNMPLPDQQKGLKQVDYMQGEGYKRFALHTQRNFSLTLRKRYAKLALDHLVSQDGATIELPGYENLVAHISQAQCYILLHPEKAIRLAEQQKNVIGQRYPTLLDKIHRILFLSHQRLQMSNNDFLRVFNGSSHSV